jgi:excisionase family DNA binding protein
MNANPCEQVFERFVDDREVAKLLRVHQATLQRMARDAQPPCMKVGKLWRFRVSRNRTRGGQRS